MNRNDLNETSNFFNIIMNKQLWAIHIHINGRVSLYRDDTFGPQKAFEFVPQKRQKSY